MGLESTLAEQYNKTLQSTIGQSQRQRQQALRQSQGQSSSDPSTDWAARQASGFRGAGFQPVSLSNVPQQQIQATKDTFGPSTAGGYTEGGQTLEGYYGSTNPYMAEGSNDLFKKAGFENLGQQSSMDLTYANLIPELTNNLMSYNGVGNSGNLYGRNGADPRKIQIANEQTLANSLTNQYNSRMNYTPTKLWKDYSGDLSSFYDVTGGGGDGGYSQTLNQDRLAAAGIRAKADPMYQNYTEYGYTPQYEQQYDAFNFDGNNYNSEAEAQAAKASKLGQLLGTTKAQQSEFLSQLLTQGAITGRNLGERGSFGGNNVNDRISGDLMKLFGSKDINYDGKTYGTILDMAGYENPLQSQWSEQNTDKSRSWNGQTKTTTTWDQGGSNLYRSLNDSNWWSQNAKNLGGGQILLTPEQLASSPGFSSIDNYVRDHGSETQKKGILQKIWESSSPTSLLLRQDFEDMQPIGAAVGNWFVPGLGSALNAVDSYSKGDSQGGQNWLKGAAMSYIGGSLNDMGAGAAVGADSATGLGTTAGNAIVAGGMGGLGAALQGGDARSILTGIAAGGLGSGLGSAVSDSFGGYMGDIIGKDGANTAGNVAGSMASQGLQNLLSKNKFGQNMGMAAVQGGMASLGNLFAPKGSTSKEVQQYNKLGKEAGGLAKTLYKQQKTKVK